MSINQYNAIFSIQIPDKCHLYSNRDLIDVFQIFFKTMIFFTIFNITFIEQQTLINILSKMVSPMTF